MSMLKRLAFVATLGAFLSIAARGAELSGTVNLEEQGQRGFGNVDATADRVEAAPEPLPLPEEKQKTQYAEEARKAMKKALDGFVALAEEVGRASERSYHATKESLGKAFTVAKKHTHSGYLHARAATAKGLQTLGRRLELPSETSHTTPVPDTPESSVLSPSEALPEKTASDVEGKDTEGEDSATVSTEPSFTSSVHTEQFAGRGD